MNKDLEREAFEKWYVSMFFVKPSEGLKLVSDRNMFRAWQAARAQGGQGAEVVDLKEFWQKLQTFVDDYVSGYEFRGDGDYTPNEKEQILIEDCVAGLLHELSTEGYLSKPAQPNPVGPDGGQGAEPIGWVHSKHLKELESGHPIRVYHQDTPVVFDSKVPIYTQPQPAVPEGEERLTDVYRRQLFECQDALNNLRSEYHNRTAELETEIEDLQEELQRVRRQADPETQDKEQSK